MDGPWPDRRGPVAAVLCDRGNGSSPVRNFGTVDAARAAAQRRPCGPRCQGVHVLLVRTGRVDPSGYRREWQPVKRTAVP